MEYQSRLKSLEGTLISKFMVKNKIPGTDSQDDIIVELYRLASLVYLWRGSACPGIRDTRLGALIDRGFDLIRDLKQCDRSFPLMVIGSEARSDEERIVMLDLIQRTGARHNEGILMRLRIGLEMIWSQRDLEADEDEYFDQLYLHRMDTVISSACTLPFFS